MIGAAGALHRAWLDAETAYQHAQASAPANYGTPLHHVAVAHVLACERAASRAYAAYHIARFSAARCIPAARPSHATLPQLEVVEPGRPYSKADRGSAALGLPRVEVGSAPTEHGSLGEPVSPAPRCAVEGKE